MLSLVPGPSVSLDTGRDGRRGRLRELEVLVQVPVAEKELV